MVGGKGRHEWESLETWLPQKCFKIYNNLNQAAGGVAPTRHEIACQTDELGPEAATSWSELGRVIVSPSRNM